MEPQWIRAPACWIELSVERLLHNLAGVRRLVGPRPGTTGPGATGPGATGPGTTGAAAAGARIMAVVKANAYGAGAPGMARVLSAAGVDAFAAGSVAEAAALRAGGIRGVFCCLTYFTDQDARPFWTMT